MQKLSQIIRSTAIRYQTPQICVNSRFINLKSENGTIIGKLKLTDYEKSYHINRLLEYSGKMIALLVFLLTILITVLFFKAIINIESDLMRIIIVSGFLFL